MLERSSIQEVITAVGDEGGYAPDFDGIEDALSQPTSRLPIWNNSSPSILSTL